MLYTIQTHFENHEKGNDFITQKKNGTKHQKILVSLTAWILVSLTAWMRTTWTKLAC
jgi:hypothetical protein